MVMVSVKGSSSKALVIFSAMDEVVFWEMISEYSVSIALLTINVKSPLSNLSKSHLFFDFLPIAVNRMLESITSLINQTFLKNANVHSPKSSWFHQTICSFPKVDPFHPKLYQQNNEQEVV